MTNRNDVHDRMTTAPASQPGRLSGESDADYWRRKFEAAAFVRGEREAELLDIKGPCRVSACRLHYAHSGPCDIAAGVRR